ncbi:MAG: acyltransferase [Rubrivivax sp.]|nr:MAG: acyltransferase [Rubrivivax sp.]
MTERVNSLDIAKGIAIVLVVVGHVAAREEVPGADWYNILRSVIYSFHMPLFMVLSGISLGLSWKVLAHDAAVLRYVGKRLKKLVIPYAALGLIIIVGKLVASRYIHVDNVPPDVLTGLLDLFLRPMASAASFLWFIYVLSAYFLVFPWLLQRAPKATPWCMLVLGVVLYQWTWPGTFNIANIVMYLPFFSAGILMGQHWRQATRVIHPWTVLWALPFFAAVAWEVVTREPLPKWLVGTLSVPFVLALSEQLQGRLKSVFLAAGLYTFSIYLFNTLCIGVAKAVTLHIVPWRDGYFAFHFVVLLIAGAWGPMLIKQATQKVSPRVAAYL